MAKILTKEALMYVKMQFVACALLEINDELSETEAYKQKIKFHGRELVKEIEKDLKGLNQFHLMDPTNSIHVSSAIEDIAKMVARMTLNDWLHLRAWMIQYLEQPDEVRIQNKASLFLPPITYRPSETLVLEDKEAETSK